ncbi:MAG: DUF928 domain-containing protein [Scytonematopsis contorta HA4267-MV1]|jgi:hypothetical protein|nr:DUF928 domain-containing protein [Scytonematopsis contorta HA4267-MV1]
MRLIFTIALILTNTIPYPIQAIAQTQKLTQTNNNTSRPALKLPKGSPTMGTVTGRRQGMGSRDNCPAVATQLTALVPSLPKNDVGGLTISERPTFLFYVPYTSNLPNANAQFTLNDSADNKIYTSPVALPSKPSVVAVSLPAHVILQENQTYHWYFKVNCSQQQAANVSIYVEGGIQRIKLNTIILQQLEAAKPQQKAVIYADNGIWFDAINTLVQLSRSNPNDTSIKADWQSLLLSVGLESLSSFPFSF